MTIFDVVTVVLGVIIGYSVAKYYAEDLFPKDFFHKPKHKKKSVIRKWLERVAFFVLGGD